MGSPRSEWDDNHEECDKEVAVLMDEVARLGQRLERMTLIARRRGYQPMLREVLPMPAGLAALPITHRIEVRRKSTRYVATMNVPGYLPMNDDPPVFDTAKEAWGYLATERRNEEDETDYPSESPLSYEYSDVVQTLEHLASDAHEPGNPHEDTPTNADGTGSVYGPTPGREDEPHDLGIAYNVDVYEED